MKKIFFILFLYSFCCYSKGDEDKEIVKEGNLALPSSQQPGPLFSFGQNIIDKGDFQTYTYLDQLKGINKNIIEVSPSFLYGISDSFSVFGYFPFAVTNKLNNNCSSGIEDMYVQFEYAFYLKEKETFMNQATIVGSILFPTGSIQKNPPTGFGTTSVFLGTTISHLAIDWYYFSSLGIEIIPNQQNKLGSKNILFEGGIGRNIAYSSDKWLLMWLLELNFFHSENNSLNNFRFIKYGSESLFIGPSLFFSTQKLIVQAGIAFPIYQKFNNQINKNDFYAAIDISWKFN